MIKENYKQDVQKKDANDLICSKPIRNVPWSTLYYKLNDPYWDKSDFFSKLTPEEGKTLIDQLRKELKHEDSKTPNKKEAMPEVNPVQSQKDKIKHTKAIYTVSADFAEDMEITGERDKVGVMGLALIDRQVLVYFLKQNGTKINLIEQFSFYVHFPNKGSVSSLSIERYVGNGRPIMCLGSQNGDIAIYYLDGKDSKGKFCQSLIE